MTRGGGAEAPRALVLEPVPPRIVDGAWRRDVEGSALVWHPAARLLTYRPPTRRPDAGWSLAVDDAALAALVHVRAELPYRSSGFAVLPEIVDVYVLVDEDGRLLVPPLASGVLEFFPGWYRPVGMQSLAEAMGAQWREDRPSTWYDLNTRYPTLLPYGRAYARTARAFVVASAAMAVVWLVLGLGGVVLGIVIGPWGVAALAPLPLGLAVLFFRNAAVFRRAVGGPGG